MHFLAGKHHFLAMTKKYTTGAPHFIETGHIELAPVSAEKLNEVQDIVFHALDSLEIQNGASHTELKIDNERTHTNHRDRRTYGRRLHWKRLGPAVYRR